MSKPTAIVYLDAFNLYKGQLEKRPENKWVNLESLFDRVLADYDVIKIHYFTGRVRGNAFPDDPTAPDRQDALIRAIDTLDRVQTHLSQFSVRQGRARAVIESEPPSVIVDVWKVQEKGTDVKLAVQLLVDAVDHAADLLVVVSGDSDLAAAISTATGRFNQRVAVLYPRESRSKQLESAGIDFSLYLHPSHVAASQFPQTVIARNGRSIRRPAEWKKQNPAV